MTNKTKQIKNGVPVADAQGHVSVVSLLDLAKQVGALLGVQKIKCKRIVSSGAWYRIANVAKTGNTSAIILFGHGWNSGMPAGLIIAFNASASGQEHTHSLVQLSGSNDTILKIRYVQERKGGDDGCGFLDIFIREKTLELMATALSLDGLELISDLTEAPQLSDEKVYEILTSQMGGGKSQLVSALQCITDDYHRSLGERRVA